LQKRTFMYSEIINNIVVRTCNENVFIELFKFCKKRKINLERLNTEEEVRKSVAEIYVVDYASHKYANTNFIDMFNQLPFDKTRIVAVFVVGKRVFGKYGVLKISHFVDINDIEKTLIEPLNKILLKSKPEKHEIFEKKIERIVEILKLLQVDEIRKPEFCARSKVSRKTLDRDLLLINLVKGFLRNLNQTDNQIEFLEENSLNHSTNTLKLIRRRMFRIIYMYMHISVFGSINIKNFCKYLNISERTLRRDALSLNAALHERQIIGESGFYK